MKRLLCGLCLWALFLPLLPVAASAQYMFVDVDGDGVNTDADVIQPSGSTTLDLWLWTDANRDGSAATCVTGDGELSITGYEFNLRAVNGTVAWGAFTNQVTEFGSGVGATSSTTELRAGATGATLPPGAYLLGSVVVSVASGTPSIAIVPRTALAGSFGTGFGSQCSGSEFTNILKLGVDWHDVDGVAYGGVANHPPVLDPVPELVVREGEVLEQALSASDEDGDPLQFTKRSGPSYLAITTVDPGTGTATGLARLTPGLTDAGSAVGSVEVSDGVGTDSQQLQITVQDSNRAPVLVQPADMTVFVGNPAQQELEASDADGGVLQFSLASGPSYVTVLTVDPISPARGRIDVLADEDDAGPAYVTVAASDGMLRDEKTFEIRVLQFAPTAPLLCRPYDMTVMAGTHAEQVLMGTSFTEDPIAFFLQSGPAFAAVTTVDTDHDPSTGLLALDPTAADRNTYTLTIGVTDGLSTSYEAMRVTVADHPIVTTAAPELLASSYRAYDVPFLPQSISPTDLNEDGLLDLVITNQGCGISIYFGIGAGQFGDRRDYHTVGEPRSADVADLDLDGHVDVAVATGFGDRVLVFSGDGTGALTLTAELAAGPNVTHVAIGDLNRDGIPDLVGANENASSLSVYLGQGARGYGSRQDYFTGSTPCYTHILDLNHDGILDVAETTEGQSEISIFIGNGDGTLRPRVPYGSVPGPTAIESGDFDEDGHPDLVVPAFHGTSVSVFFGDGSGAFPRRSDFAVGVAPWSVCVADLNGDGHADIVSANTGDNNVSILLGHGDGTFEPQRVEPAGIYARFVIATDLNGDGKPEIAVVNEGSGTLMVLRGNGDGTFGSARRIAVAGEPSDISIGDLNRDGLADMAVQIQRNSAVWFYAGRPHGAFDPPVILSPGGTPGKLHIADMNGDGAEDLLVSLPEQMSIAVYPGGAGFGAAPPISVSAGLAPRFIASGDWNRDGRRDLAVASQLEPVISVVFGDGAGGFDNLTQFATFGEIRALGTGDFDGDGITDLAVSQGPNGIMVRWGDDGSFVHSTPLTELSNVTGFASGDIDGDGRSELAAAVDGRNGGFFGIGHGQLVLYSWDAGRGLAPTRMAHPGGPAPHSPAIADLNADGKMDLLITEGGGGVGIFLGEGARSFGPRQDYGAGVLPGSSGVQDIDGDGRPDVLTTDWLGQTISILRNLSGPTEPPPLAARAFPATADRIVRLRSDKPSVCAQLEAVGGAFSVEDVTVATVRLGRADSDADPIAALGAKHLLVADTDRNGVPEIALCFAKDAVRTLFADVRGAADVPMVLTGALADGRRFEARFDVRVIPAAGGPPLAARVTPNPMNPAATLTYVIDRPGPVRVTIFDVHGRTVATLLDSKSEEPGEHRIQLGAGARAGSELASGIYFYRVETREDRVNGRFAVLK